MTKFYGLLDSIDIEGDVITPHTELIDTQELEDILSLSTDEDMIEYLKTKYIDEYSQQKFFDVMREHPYMTIAEFIANEYKESGIPQI